MGGIWIYERRRPRRRIAWLAACGLVLIGLVVTSVGASAEDGLPHVAFEGSPDGKHTTVRVTDQAGTAVTLNKDAEAFQSISGGRVAFTHRRSVYASDVIVKDAVTGERLNRVSDARYPLIFGDGTQVVFLPDRLGTLDPEERDEHANSVWYRDLVSGEERKLFQASDWDLWDHRPQDFAVPPTGDRVAFTVGEGSFLFEWNIWIVNTDGTGLQQLTSDDRSLSPSFSPDGQTIAYTRYVPFRPCRGGLQLMNADGTNVRVLTKSTCDVHYTRPVWLDDQTIVSLIRERQPGGWYDPAGLAIISSQTGEVLEQIATGFIVDYVVARDAGQVIYRKAKGRIVSFDVVAGTAATVPGGKELFGWHLHADGSLELSI
jgi:WD40-like Beta Propeller Repeat